MKVQIILFLYPSTLHEKREKNVRKISRIGILVFALRIENMAGSVSGYRKIHGNCSRIMEVFSESARLM